MIQVDRTPDSHPKCLLASHAARRREMDAARDHHDRVPPPTRAYPFKVYRKKKVRESLSAMFQGKCAYCESKFESTSYGPVEHYRPKSKYWFLASEWSNLLWSCTVCNTKKSNEFPVEGDHFPDEANWQSERPLLLNPCEPGFDAGTIQFGPGGTVQARRRKGRRDPRGAATIKVVGLDRDRLKEAREEKLRNLELYWSLLEQALRSGNGVEEAKQRLIEAGAPGAQFAVMARQFVADHDRFVV